MKKIALLALTVLIMVGCEDQQRYAKALANNDNFGVCVYDSCEYVVRSVGYKGFLAHKGNCKFCAERRKKELDSLAIKIWEGFE